VTDERDRWARWLLEQRHGGDPAELERQLPNLEEFRRRVLENADLRKGDVVLDVGTGNGLIAFGALERVGPNGRVIFSDVSEDLLDECRRIAAELGVADRSEFLLASADDLPLPDASVDVVTTRSVLIYLMDKRPAFAEFFRVLRIDYRAEIKHEPHWTQSWDTLKRWSANPLDPTVEEELGAALDDEERAEFEQHLRVALERRPLVETRMASAYLRAVKPAD
jgi:ubiquinone/menaquinone biosynthesis C-methylase UbiE